MDHLERAEAFAKKLAQSRDSGQFPYIGPGGRGIIQVFMAELRNRDAERVTMQATIESLGKALADYEKRLTSLEERALTKWDEPKYECG